MLLKGLYGVRGDLKGEVPVGRLLAIKQQDSRIDNVSFWGRVCLYCELEEN